MLAIIINGSVVFLPLLITIASQHPRGVPEMLVPECRIPAVSQGIFSGQGRELAHFPGPLGACEM